MKLQYTSNFCFTFIHTSRFCRFGILKNRCKSWPLPWAVSPYLTVTVCSKCNRASIVSTLSSSKEHISHLLSKRTNVEPHHFSLFVPSPSANRRTSDKYPHGHHGSKKTTASPSKSMLTWTIEPGFGWQSPTKGKGPTGIGCNNKCRLGLRRNWPSGRAIRHGYRLPREVVHFLSLDVFTNQLDKDLMWSELKTDPALNKKLDWRPPDGPSKLK